MMWKEIKENLKKQSPLSWVALAVAVINLIVIVSKL